MIETSQDEAIDHTPEKSWHQQAHLHAHVQIWEERHQLGLPQTNLKKSDSVSPDDEKNVQEKETSSWLSS